MYWGGRAGEKQNTKQGDDPMPYILGSVIQMLSAKAVESLKTFNQEREVISAGLQACEISRTMFSMMFSRLFLFLYVLHKSCVILR